MHFHQCWTRGCLWKSTAAEVIHCFTTAVMVSLLETLPLQSIFHWVEVRRHQVWWVWQDSPTKIGSVLHSLQTVLGPGVIVSQDKSCLLCPDWWSLSLQLSLCHDVAVVVDGLSRFHEIWKSHPFPISKDSAHYFTRWGCCLELLIQQGIHT